MHRIFALALLAATALSPLPVSAQDHPLKGVALVIGESDYAALQKLDNPKRDARAMDDMLDSLGFSVERVLDGDAKKLRGEIADFVDQAKDADVALVYYSGHGIEAGGADYLVPTDTSLATPQTAGESLVPVSDMLDQLAKTVPVTIVLLDACRTNSFPEGQLIQLPGTTQTVEVAPSGLEAMRGPVPVAKRDVSADNLGMVIGFAASPGQPALDGAPDGNSPYAAALLKHFAAGGYSFGDLMTMVSEEVYLETKARQLPWVNSSLRRVLSFGKPVDEGDSDEQAIRDGRRKLLLTIAGEPEATQRYIETVATQEGVPLDALYGMLKVLGVDTTKGTDLEAELRQGAEKLKAFMAEKPGGAKTDTELVRLADLAQKAQDEGAIDLALKYRADASKRADAMSASLDVTEANLEQDRIQLGATYAEHARTAELNFDFGTAAQMWGKAYDQVAKWQPDAALSYKLGEAAAYLSDGQHRGSAEALSASVSTYGDAEALTKSGTDEWAKVHLALGQAYDALGQLKQDSKILARATHVVSEVGEYYDQAGAPSGEAMMQALRAFGMASLHLSFITQSRDDYQSAVDALGMAAKLADRHAAPLDWAAVQASLGTAQQALGLATADPGTFKSAIASLTLALEEQTRERGPFEWARVQAELGITLADYAQVPGNGDRGAILDQSIGAFEAALEVQTRDHAPHEWASTQSNLGLALLARWRSSRDGDDLADAAAALQAAREEQPVDTVPHDWAMTTRSIGFVERLIADGGSGVAGYDQAIADLQSAIDVLQRDESPLIWAETLVVLGDAEMARGKRSGDQQDFEAALKAYKAALPTYEQSGGGALQSLQGKLQAVKQALRS